MFIDEIKAVDNHCHSIYKEMNHDKFISAFSETGDDTQLKIHTQETIFYKRSIKKLSSMFDSEIDSYYNKSREKSMKKLTELFINKSNLEYLFIDDGFLSEQFYDISFFKGIVKTKRILRIEWIAEKLIKAKPTFDKFVDEFISELEDDSETIISYKSIAAYRCGLDLIKVSFDDVKKEYYRIIDSGESKLTSKILISFLVECAFKISSKRKIPIQFHTGFGDNDLDLTKSNPLLLKKLIEANKSVPVILLHSSYPFMREAGYMASIYSNVYVDLGLVSPYLSIKGFKNVLSNLFELGPWTKILYSSDASKIPELYYLSSDLSRSCIHEVLFEFIESGEINRDDYKYIARGILRENAQKLYDLT
ncbi:MAG: uncharacterized protein PWQ77_163 [Kosmotogales bacterium]|nr:uncharacterized protein [Kosmotogales bacterium]